WKFVTSSTTAGASWIHRRIMTGKRTFPIDTSSPYAAKRMAEFLANKGRLVLFPEGRISMTGSLMKLFDGTGFLLKKSNAKVITCYLRNASRVPWVRHDGWTCWFPRVSAHFSRPVTAPSWPDLPNAISRERLTNWLYREMSRQQFEVEMELGPTTVLAAIAETAGFLPRKKIMEDISLAPLTYRRLMVGTELLAGALERNLAAGTGGRRIAVLLPNVNGMPVTVLALWALGHMPAILNFSTGVPTMLSCLQLGGITELVTSHQFLQKAKLDVSLLLQAGIKFHYLEDIRPEIGGLAKVLGLFRHTWDCGGVFRKTGHPRPIDPGETAVILFTSGSEGVPKGVELSHHNLLANIRQIMAYLDISDGERFFNALPLFHSFGLTGCTLLPLVRGLYVFLYPSPLHYRVIPSAIYDRDCTVMMGTNTFLNGYARRASPYDFRNVKYLVAGAEKVQEATANIYARKFGVRLLEGYGATECSPAVCINTRINPRFGTVGQFLPGIEWKLENVEGVAEGGRLFVRGPNIMKGYLNPEANQHFQSLGGWYDTGDIAKVDGDGYVTLLGRMKRFAKVSGEMVSLAAVEDALAGAFPDLGQRCEVAVIAIPDEDKGEKLIAIVNDEKLTLDRIRAAIKAKGLTNLCAPREVCFLREIPKLGTGKTNHRELAEWYKKQGGA
ncbi:MAG TPA: AMP-binding protein, partial [Candidatus Limnocylindria bacterium]|nr:AMP-binding protein [Candidatus Limnocylindria bacterium]